MLLQAFNFHHTKLFALLIFFRNSGMLIFVDFWLSNPWTLSPDTVFFLRWTPVEWKVRTLYIEVDSTKLEHILLIWRYWTLYKQLNYFSTRRFCCTGSIFERLPLCSLPQHCIGLKYQVAFRVITILFNIRPYRTSNDCFFVVV